MLFRSEASAKADPGVPDDHVLQNIAIVTTCAIYVQILIGATMRHTGAGLAIPDFPLAFGHLLPPMWSAAIAIHYTHRIGALIVTTLVLATALHALVRQRGSRALGRPALLLIVLVAVQVTLGAATVLSGKQYLINSLHVVCGSFVLGTSLVLTLRANYPRFIRPAGAVPVAA